MPSGAVKFLLKYQCADGGFDDSSIGPEPGLCRSEQVTTAYAVQALLAVGHHQAAVKRALDRLQTRQGADGGFGEIGGEPGEDVPTTGPVATALALGGRHVAAVKAITFLTALPAGCTSLPVDQGAIKNGARGTVVSGTDFDAIGTIDATIAAIPALTRTGFADASAKGARPNPPQLRCPTS